MRIFRQSSGRTGCEFAKLSNPIIPAKAGIHCTSQFTQAMPGIYMTYVHPSTELRTSGFAASLEESISNQ
ncbi:uncharacterized protein METZ01_LOCUS422891 [marine metagenome]|uniref:Uncharacterized protein n=1 Tax=marine metagenome TaxID=408172 RepID=A0A382XFT7_9ZZZZ